MKSCFFCVLVALGALSLMSTAGAQNVTDYGMMADPTLFLLREPAIHAELRLTDAQKKKLVVFNETLDSMLLASRNMPPEEAQKNFATAVEKSREHVTRSFSEAQRLRMRQVMYRLKGIAFVLIPTVAEQMGLTEQQQERIAATIKTALAKISEVQTDTFQGKDAFEKTQTAIMAARKEEQSAILAILTAEQKQLLNTLIGPGFDQTQLGRVSFKAPDLTGGTEWINSSEMKLEDMRGKVIALHFFAFG